MITKISIKTLFDPESKLYYSKNRFIIYNKEGFIMEGMLERMVIFIAKIHNYILTLNDAYEKNFTDKQLHFLVIGIVGMLILGQ